MRRCHLGGRPSPLVPAVVLLVLLAACDGPAADSATGTSQPDTGAVPERHAPFTALWENGEVGRIEAGALTLLPGTYSDATKVLQYSGGIAVETLEGIDLIEADGTTDISNGSLLAVSRSGNRIAYLQEQRLVIYESGRESVFVVECIGSANGVWDRSDTVLGVVCGQSLHIIFEGSGDVFTRQTPARAIDITRWGEGFAVLLSTRDGRVELHRTPCHQQAVYGKLESLADDVVQVVGGSDNESLVTRTSEGDVEIRAGSELAVLSGKVLCIDDGAGPVSTEYPCPSVFPAEP